MALAGSKRKHCPHCEEEVALSTFKYHKRVYYNGVSVLSHILSLWLPETFNSAKVQ